MTSPQEFYIYRGEIMGLEYQKAADFAREHNLILDVQIARSTDSLLAWVAEGRVDLSITPIAMTKAHTEAYDFAGIVDTTALVLVQKGKNLLRNLSEIAGKEVWCGRGAGVLRLKQIEEEIGQPIDIVAPDTLGIEELLVEMAQEDSIEYAIAGEGLVALLQRYYPNLDGSLRVSAPIRYAWAVAKNNKTLADQLDGYLLTPERQRHYTLLRQQSSHLHHYIIGEANRGVQVKLKDGNISPYDDIFKKYAQGTPWSWTLLAAIAYHESRFTSDVIGWSGARGLMGIMPRTGRAFGATIEQLLLPEVSVEVAVKVLNETTKYFSNIKDPTQRLCFTLAGYNAGVGHVQDAMRLAHKYNAPDSLWSGGIREFILLKSNPEYYNDEVVRNGYLRGRETSNYVDQVIERKAAYDALIK